SARARIRVRPPARILVGGHGAGVLLRLHRYDGEADARGSPAVRQDVYHRQATYRRRSALTGNAPASRVDHERIGDAAGSAMSGPAVGSSRTRAVVAILAAATAVAALAHSLGAQAD